MLSQSETVTLGVQCDVADLLRALTMTPPPILLDVREDWEVALCRLPGAVHIPLGQLPQRLDELQKDQAIVAYCHHGVRSLQAAAMLRMGGIGQASSLRGGIHAWAEQVDPSMAKY